MLLCLDMSWEVFDKTILHSSPVVMTSSHKCGMCLYNDPLFCVSYVRTPLLSLWQADLRLSKADCEA